MSNPTTPKGFLSLITAVFVFSLVVEINFYEIFNLLHAKGLSHNEIDKIEVMEFLSEIAGGVLFTQIVNKYYKKTILMVTLAIYLVCITNLAIFNNINILTINLMLASLCRYIFYGAAMLKSLSFFRRNASLDLTIFFSTWVIASMISKYLIEFISDIDAHNIFISLAVIQVFTILSIYFLVERVKVSNIYQLNLVSLLKSMELEVLSGFFVIYVIFSIYWNYEVFAQLNGYYISAIEDARFHMVCGVLVSLYPLMQLTHRYNKYKLNIYLIILFIIASSCLKEFGAYKYWNMIVYSIIGAALYGLFINNLVIITDKFINEERNYAIAVYLNFSVIGSYVGIIATDNLMETFGAFGFLLSLYSVAGFFLAYYLLQFLSQRLYRL